LCNLWCHLWPTRTSRLPLVRRSRSRYWRGSWTPMPTLQLGSRHVPGRPTEPRTCRDLSEIRRRLNAVRHWPSLTGGPLSFPSDPWGVSPLRGSVRCIYLAADILSDFAVSDGHVINITTDIPRTLDENSLFSAPRQPHVGGGTRGGQPGTWPSGVGPQAQHTYGPGAW
jgi:hypothetical protein